MDWTIITKAGLSKTDAAQLLGVSHVMVWKYGRGAKPVGETKKRAEILLFILERLVEKGVLPKVDIPPTRRMAPEVKERRDRLIKKLNDLLEQRLELASANE